MPEVSDVLEAELRHGELQLGDRWRLGRRLKERGYGQAYVLPNTMKSALAPSFARIPERIGYLGESRVGLLNRIHKAKQAREPMTLHYARLAEEPGTEPVLPSAFPSLSFSKGKIKKPPPNSASPATTRCSRRARSSDPPSAGRISAGSPRSWIRRSCCWVPLAT